MTNNQLRKFRGKQTQKQVAEKLGISQQRYSLYETGERKIPKIVEKLVQALKRIEEFDDNKLLGGESSPQAAVK